MDQNHMNMTGLKISSKTRDTQSESSESDSSNEHARQQTCKYTENVHFRNNKQHDEYKHECKHAALYKNRRVNYRDDNRNQRYDYNTEARNRAVQHQNDKRRIQRGKEYYDSSSDSENNQSGRLIKSGINAKPTSSVREQLKYPHFSLGQVSGYIGQNVQFHQLTYDQFVAGELTTIINSEDPAEQIGRTELLQHVALWKLRSNVTWQQIRSTYEHVIRRIENQEIGWDTDWERYEKHIYDKVPTKVEKSRAISKTANNGDIVWFCKSYQRPDGCNRNSPHVAKVSGVMRQVHHICATCWYKEKASKPHSESSAECPYKEA